MTRRTVHGHLELRLFSLARSVARTLNPEPIFVALVKNLLFAAQFASLALGVFSQLVMYAGMADMSATFLLGLPNMLNALRDAVASARLHPSNRNETYKNRAIPEVKRQYPT